MTPLEITLILLAHYLGDWVAQPFMQKWMGRKNESWAHLGTHVAVLSVPLIVLSPVWGIVNGIAHGAVDAATSRLTHRFHGNGRMDLFWLTIGTDQTIHLLTLFLTWGLLA